MIEGRIITVGKKIVAAGWRCIRCSIETNDRKAPSICPRCYGRMDQIKIEYEEKMAV